jgi:protein-tyrosine-phosphatase
VSDPGKPLAPEAAIALRELGVEAHPHGSQPLTTELCEGASAIFCMTEEQRRTVLAIAPSVAARTFRLDPDADLAEPDHGSKDAWNRFAAQVTTLVRGRLADLEPALAPAPA